MGIVPLLVICSMVAAAIFLVAFLWASANGQYDDMHTPALRMLFPERAVQEVYTDVINQSLPTTNDHEH
jgi:cbb3-type cytochrome oxidase maturation protein